ncbi:MAG TPA: PVC-type heme-binding CxxCH protein, partial [Isosphaeraceae bacterium]
MRIARPRWARPALFVAMLSLATPAQGALPKVPDGFKIRLVAAVPAVTFPCQVATRPDGALFVAEDPMDQVGPYEADLGRILLFRDGKDPVVFAEGFRAIFGMAWRGDALYVMNMPRLTVLRDTNGDGKADERKDLFTDLGPKPKPGGLNDHIVSGLQFGMDGWLYISVGDKGVPGVHGPDGRTAQLKGGGTMRCRPDGTGIEVISTGTRNHLEPNLDARDNLFTYDNTDDGDGWWTRVTHHIDGGYYGYAYDYHNHKDRMLDRMAEYGGGSPCGGVVYKEDAWPEKYRGLGLWAEWGKGHVAAIRFEPNGASFKVAEYIKLVEKPDGEEFRLIDLALSYDGKTLYIADWGMGGWGTKTDKVGRVYALTYEGNVETKPRGKDSDPIAAQIKALAHPAFTERMRAQAALIKRGREALEPVTRALRSPTVDPVSGRHLVWTYDALAGASPAAEGVLSSCLHSQHADIRAQAARALGLRASKLAADTLRGTATRDSDPAVRLQAIIALGRIGDPVKAFSLLPTLADPDPYLAFATRVVLRRVGRWQMMSPGLDDPKVRHGLLAAMEGQYNLEAVGLLDRFIRDHKRPADERAKALSYLAQAHHKTPPWDGSWWGTRPTQGKPPAKSVAWEGTPAVLGTVRAALGDDDAPVRLAAVSAVKEANDREALPKLRERFAAEPDEKVRREIAAVFGAMDDKAALPLLISALRHATVPESVREASLVSIEEIGTDAAIQALVDLLRESGLKAERQARLIASLGRFKARAAVPTVVAMLTNPDPKVRAAAAEALGKIGDTSATPKVRPLLKDDSLDVRKAAIAAVAALKDRESIPGLIAAAESEPTRYEATIALASMPDIRSLH